MKINLVPLPRRVNHVTFELCCWWSSVGRWASLAIVSTSAVSEEARCSRHSCRHTRSLARCLTLRHRTTLVSTRQTCFIGVQPSHSATASSSVSPPHLAALPYPPSRTTISPYRSHLYCVNVNSVMYSMQSSMQSLYLIKCQFFPISTPIMFWII